MSEPLTVEQIREGRIKDVIEQCTLVAIIHRKMLHNEKRDHELDSMRVRRLIRTLVEEWV